MRVYTDDEIYRVDQVFLGPDRFRFPWRWTYRQYAGFGVLFVASQALLRFTGIDMGFWSLAFSLVVSAGVVSRFGRFLSGWERSLRTMWREFALELRGPRRRSGINGRNTSRKGEGRGASW